MYRICLILILLILTAPTQAGEKRYRVEILVLSHLQHEAIPAEADSLRDFSTALDFLTPEVDESEKEGLENTPFDEAESSSQVPEADEANSADLLQQEELPEQPWADVIPVEQMSNVMSEAWRRLRLSAPFRPEQYLSWEQSANEPFPLLRIHDLKVVLIDDPYADLRKTDVIEDQDDRPEADKTAVFSDRGRLLPGYALDDAISELAVEPELPDPSLFYRLDGTVMLRRTRFLHLDVDLELRQPVFDDPALAPVPIPSLDSESTEPTSPVPSSFLIHTLKQSRQVKSQRMEYFDSPVLGVLAWITPFEREDEIEAIGSPEP